MHGTEALVRPLELNADEVSIPIVGRLEFAAVDGNQCFQEQSHQLTQHHKLKTNSANYLAVVFAKVGDGFEVGHQRPVSHINSTLR